MNHETITKGEAHVQAQIEAVPEQSTAYRELDAKIRKAAGDKLASPIKIRMKSTGAVIETGFEHAHKAVISGVATLAD